MEVADEYCTLFQKEGQLLVPFSYSRNYQYKKSHSYPSFHKKGGLTYQASQDRALLKQSVRLDTLSKQSESSREVLYGSISLSRKPASACQSFEI